MAKVKDKMTMFEGIDDYVECISFSPNNEQLLSVCESDLIFWDIKTKEKVKTIQLAEYIFEAGFFPNGQQVYVRSLKKIHIYDLKSEQETYIFEPKLSEQEILESVACSADGNYLAVGVGQNVQLLDWQKAEVLYNFEEPNSAIINLVFSPDGKKLAGGCEEKTVFIWDITNGHKISSCEAPESIGKGLSFSTDSNSLIYRDDEHIYIVDVISGQQLRSIDSILGMDSQMAIFADGQKVFVGGHNRNRRKNKVKLLDLEKEEVINEFAVGSCCIHSIAFSSDGKMVALSNCNKDIKLWLLP